MDHEWLFSTVIRFCALQPDVKKIQEKYLLNPFRGVPKASDFILWVIFHVIQLNIEITDHFLLCNSFLCIET